jgi:hypothetical protein
MLESQIWLVTKLVLGLDFFDEHHILNSDAELAIFVVARLVGENVACCEGNLGELNAGANTNWTLVNV